MQKSRSFDLAKNIRLIGLIFAAPSPFKDTCAKKKVTLLGFRASVFQKEIQDQINQFRASNGRPFSAPKNIHLPYHSGT